MGLIQRRKSDPGKERSLLLTIIMATIISTITMSKTIIYSFTENNNNMSHKIKSFLKIARQQNLYTEN